jgi:hypothetical protein
LGDTLQFIRYVAPAKTRAPKLVIQVPGVLLPILTCSGYQRLFPLEAPPPPHDAQASLADLPELFGSTLETVPAAVPYLFADERLVAAWRNELAQREGYRVGIAWQGNPSFQLDRLRSIPLQEFEPLARVRGVRLVSLQRHSGLDQLDALARRFDVERFDDRLDTTSGSFMDTAAVMKNLDLVVTSDTSIAHLAGALGVPTWVVLPSAPDWRWLLHRQDSPWYPTMRLWRQTHRGEWSDVMHQVAAELAHRVAAKSGSREN